MIHGRVIGNELRDVPPERLPVWGQRWFRSRRALGPSRYFMHTFCVNGMTEAAPVLSSPAQFELTITEEDDDDDDDESSASQLPSPLPFSPLYAQTCPTELAPSDSNLSSLQAHNPSVYHHHSAPTTPTSLRQANHTLRPNSVHSLASQNAVHPDAMFLPRRHSEHLGTPRNVPGCPMPPPTQHPALPVGGYHVSPGYDLTLGHINFPSTDMQHRASPSHVNHLPSGRLPLQQFVSAHHATPQVPIVQEQPPVQFFQPHPDSNHFPQLLQADNQTMSVPTRMTSGSHNFLALPQQNVGSGSSWNNHANMLAIEQPPDPVSILRIPPENTTSGWPSGSTPNYLTFPEVLLTQATGPSPPTPDDLWNVSSDQHRNPSPLEGSLTTFTYSCIKGSILFDSVQSYNRPGSRPTG
ncbi:hypothetical protein BS17DRAFT_500185 [Gyrodon lividus]|nr:hypothetical protein BS17DRAFT_500185 [Gyrodon lividus]